MLELSPTWQAECVRRQSSIVSGPYAVTEYNSIRVSDYICLRVAQRRCPNSI